MDWIKKNPHQFGLGVLAVALLGMSGVIIKKSLEIGDTFSAILSSPHHDDKLPEIEKGPVEAALVKLKEPVAWAPKPLNGSLFVAKLYYIDQATNRPKLMGGKDGDKFNDPVPDKWLIKFAINPLAPKVIDEDPDNDGFSTLDEFLGIDHNAENGEDDSTNPQDPKSHPPHHAKLYLKQYIKVAFRLLFDGYNGDPKDPESMDFQINTLDLRQPTAFLKLGQTVANAPYKLEKFESKTRINPSTSAEEDVSELTLLNTETNETIVLVKFKVTNSPDSFALFTYSWPKPPQDIRVKKLQEFALRVAPPATPGKYKLIDINETGAVIALPSGEKYTVPLLPK